MTTILGISAFYHDSAASLIIDGKIIDAVQEERFTRLKHDSKFPNKCIEYIFDKNNLKLEQLDFIVFYEKPFLKFERLLETYLAFAPKGFSQFKVSMPKWISEKLFLKSLIINELKKFDSKFDKQKLRFSEHHFSHCSSAFYPSPFKEATIISIDGVGEWETTTIASGNNNQININHFLKFPHSIGLLYSAFTYFLGFKVNSGEYKVMGLAPYGKDKYSEIILSKLVDLKADGSFHLNQDYFDYCTGLEMTNKKFEKLFPMDRRKSELEPLEQHHMDLAKSLQVVIEKIIILIVKFAFKNYKSKNLCLSGGVALNCVANGKIKDLNLYENIWISPAAGDAGSSLGAALGFWHQTLGNSKLEFKDKKYDHMQGSFLGPQFNNKQIEDALKDYGLNYKKHLSKSNLISDTVKDLVNGKIIGWFQGRMEFGPRALGNRSIIADPRDHKMQKKLNLKIKYRESFRPFAPAILAEEIKNWFPTILISPYMLLVEKIKENRRKKILNKNITGLKLLSYKNSDVPAVTHVDYSSRIQTVHKETNPLFHSLIKKFQKETGCPMVINTSFNVRGEPIVYSPKDAIKCFLGTDLDTLVLGHFYITKSKQLSNIKYQYKNKFNLD
jgi:carbamoyltransferase